jgi:hypothetical protein
VKSIRDTADAINALHQAAHGDPTSVTENQFFVEAYNAWPAINDRLGEADALEAEVAELRALLHANEVAFDADSKTAAAALAAAEAERDELLQALDDHFGHADALTDWLERPKVYP